MTPQKTPQKAQSPHEPRARVSPAPGVPRAAQTRRTGRTGLTVRLLRADLARSRAVATALTALVALACCLVAASTSLMVTTTEGINMLWDQARPPDVVQMHSGSLDEQEVADWAAARGEVTDHQVVKTLPAPGQRLWIDGVSQADSVLEPAFVTAPQDFDLLLDEDGSPADPGPGQVALPVHYRATGQAEVGDAVVVDDGRARTELEVVGFVRDAQMNPSMVTSKRMVVSQEDFAHLETRLEPEYLVELLLADGTRPQGVIDAYTAAGLPSTGVAVDSSIFWLMNALSTTLVAAVALLVAVMLVAVALLSLRYTVLAALETDLPQLAVLKAIGLPPARTERLYLMKYTVLAVLGATTGYLASLPLAHALAAPALLYLGTPPADVWGIVLPVAAALLVAGLVNVSAWATLRRLRRTPAVEALRSGTIIGTGAGSRHRWRLAGARWLPVQVWLGLREACRPANALLAGVVAVCALTMALPVSAWTTLEDPRFVTYLGIGQADVRIDVYSGAEVLEQVEEAVASEAGVARHTTLLSRRYEMAAPEGQWESVVVEVGNHRAVPLTYVSGRPPSSPDEVALSTSQAAAVGAQTGTTVTVRTAQGTTDLAVTGTYQDITNGGRTAKAVLDDASSALRQVVYADLEDPGQGDSVVDSLRDRLPGTQVRTMDDYASQVLGATSSQLRVVALLACAIALGLAFLVTALLATLLVVRERQGTAVLRALGCTRRALTLQYLTRFMTVALAGLALGGMVAAAAGQQAVGGALSVLGGGGAQIHLLPRLWLVGGALPLALAASVAAAVLLSLRQLPAPTLTTLGAGE